jgi:hypothetical protein
LIDEKRWEEINEYFLSDEPMNWSEIEELNKMGAIIGSHCHDHTILHKNQSIKEVLSQLEESYKLIDKYINKCQYIAYPNGERDDISPEILIKVRESQYLLGFTTVRGEIYDKINPYLLPRIAPATDLNRFKFDLDTRFRFNRSYQKWCSTFAEHDLHGSAYTRDTTCQLKTFTR